MQWIRSAGGPLMLLDEQSVQQWGGTIDEIAPPLAVESYSPGGKPTDYDRACSVDGFLGRIPVGAEEALVLGDDPMATTWLATERHDSGMLVRCLCADDLDEALDSAKRIPDVAFNDEGTFRVTGPRLLLFDAAFAGRNVRKYPTEYLTIELIPGLYRVATAIFQPNVESSMVVHRLSAATC
jgi:hypothetical protein